MFGEKNENENEDLKAFEAALGSLRPRTGRLDPSLRAELAKHASVLGPLSGHQPEVGRERVRARAFGLGRTPSCTNPSGHRFLCIHCGSDAAPVRGPGRWIWPAALSTMTATAAVLLAMFVTRSQLPITRPADLEGAATPAASVAQQQPSPVFFEDGRSSDYRLVTGSSPRPPNNPGTDEMSYLSLRDQVLRDGVESWKFSVSPVATTARTKDAAEAPSAIENN